MDTSTSREGNPKSWDKDKDCRKPDDGRSPHSARKGMFRKIHDSQAVTITEQIYESAPPAGIRKINRFKSCNETHRHSVKEQTTTCGPICEERAVDRSGKSPESSGGQGQQ